MKCHIYMADLITSYATLFLVIADGMCHVIRLERNQHHLFGYPSDVMRFSWSTSREVLERMGAAKVDW
jgi:hypothetical protein